MNSVKRRGIGLYPLTVTATDEDGNPAAISAPVAVTIFDGAGAQVDSGTPSVADGVLSYALDASKVPLLDTYSAVWTGTVGAADQEWTTAFELVGDHIIELADIRAFDRAFTDTDRYPDDYLRACRDQIEELLERNGMCAFRPRGAREKLSGSGRQRLLLRNPDLREVYSLTVGGVALSPDELASLAFDGNVLFRHKPWPAGFANIAVHYSYGYDSPPGPIRRAALMLAKEHIVPSTDLSPRATASTIGDMAYRITIAGRDGFTGIPDVDAAVEQFGRVRPLVG